MFTEIVTVEKVAQYASFFGAPVVPAAVLTLPLVGLHIFHALPDAVICCSIRTPAFAYLSQLRRRSRPDCGRQQAGGQIALVLHAV